MPYFINVFRIPKPGNFTAVVKGVQESLQATGRRGFVNIPMSPPYPNSQSMAVISTVAGFETLDDVDAFYDGLLEDDMARLAARDELASMCERVNITVSHVMNPDSPPPEDFSPKIIERASVSAKRGKEGELTDVLREWADRADVPGFKVVSVTLGGERGLVRLSHMVDSLQALEDLRQQLRASPQAQRMPDLLAGPAVRGVGRIVFNSRP